MAYTPELSVEYSGILRRIAWAAGRPMTKTIMEVIDYVSEVVETKKVCKACQDDSFCLRCPFNRTQGDFDFQDCKSP